MKLKRTIRRMKFQLQDYGFFCIPPFKRVAGIVFLFVLFFGVAHITIRAIELFPIVK